jgi:gluconolactonase
VYRIGADGKVSAVITELVNPNGLAFSPDEKKLYVVGVEGHAQPQHLELRRIRRRRDRWANKVKLIDAADQGALDGFRVDRDGNLWCGWGSNGALERRAHRDGRAQGLWAARALRRPRRRDGVQPGR